MEETIGAAHGDDMAGVPGRSSGFFRSIGLEAQTDVTVQGVRTSHDIDVFVRSHHVGFYVSWIVECKRWSTPVNKLHVLALREIVSDLGADRGILLCEAGFQSGALEAASLTNVHATSLPALRKAADAEITAMRLRELFDRADNCRMRYWNIPKSVRIDAGLRPDAGGGGYSGNFVFELAADVLGKALRGNYPISLESMHGLVIFGTDRCFPSGANVLAVIEPMIADLELRLSTCENNFSQQLPLNGA